VSNIIRRYTYHMKFAVFMTFCLSDSFVFFFVLFFINVYMVVCFVYFCLIL